jgi:hypothetical protein
MNIKKIEPEPGNSKVKIILTATLGMLLLVGLFTFIMTNGAKDTQKDVNQIANVGKNSITPPSEIISVTTPTSIPPTVTPYAGKLPKSLPNLFYVKSTSVCYVSGDTIAPKEITYFPYNTQDQFYIRVSEDGKKLFYPDNIDFNETDYCGDLEYYDLSSQNPKTVKIDSKMNNFTLNQDGSRVFYLKNKDLYLSDLTTSEKLATDVIEFYINKKGDTVMFKTSDNRLFRMTKDKHATEIDSNINIQYVSPDLSTIYYFKDHSLYQLKNEKDIKLIASGLNSATASIVYIYEDGSLYYLDPNDLNSSAKTSSLYYYTNGKSTKVSDYCTNVWMYSDETKHRDYYRGNDKPILAYTQVKPSNNIVEQYLCSGPKVLKKITTGDLYKIIYDIGHERIFYINNYDEQSNQGDLYYITVNGTETEGQKYVEDFIMYDPYSIIIGNSVVYLTTGDNLGEDFYLYVNNKKIDSKVTGWIYPIKNTASFIYMNNLLIAENCTTTLNLFKDGKAIKLSDNVTSYYAFDDKCIAYVSVNANGNKQLYLYDGTDTRILLDNFNSNLVLLSDFITPEDNTYYSYYRPTVILPSDPK